MPAWLDLSTFSLTTVYWLCVLVGLGMLVVSAVFDGILDMAFDSDFGILSGPVISAFLVMLGAFGLVFRVVFHMSGAGSSIAAGLCSVAGSLIFYFGVYRFVLSQQGGTSFEPADSAGIEAEVIAAIPAGGSGEIAFDTRTGRQSGAARSVDGSAIARHAIVRIERYVAGTYHVQPIGAATASAPVNPTSQEGHR